MTETGRPDVASVMAELKDFQRATVDQVHRRLWLDHDPARRFLVADEVGLGKTLIAKGVIAKTIDHFWDDPAAEQIDVVYICSNSQIASQNVSRLMPGDTQRRQADRLTLLAKQIGKIRDQRVNIVSFTPSTSFSVRESSGRVEERALIYALLRKQWGRSEVGSAAWKKFFMDQAGPESFDRAVRALTADDVDSNIARTLADNIRTSPFDASQLLGEALEECVGQFRYLRTDTHPDTAVRSKRTHLIGQMRAAVAAAALDSLRPKLVILDEFQRFKSLLDPDDSTARLATAMFTQDTARVLLLSATPYKMFTLPDEPEGDDHYSDFEATIRFLAGKQVAEQVTTDLSIMRRGVLDSAERNSAMAARERVEAALRLKMSRTERLASTADRNGMLADRSTAIALTSADVRAFRTGQAVADLVGGDEVLEYWRSTPYLLNLMDDYKVKREFTKMTETGASALVAAVRNGDGLLEWKKVEQFQRLDPGNAKMRALVDDVIDRGAWELAWLPPSLPYYSLGGAYARPELASFTKRLIFSAWNVVPKAIATMMSYEAERAGVTRIDADRRYGDRSTALLNFSRSEGRLSGMPLLAMLYPSVALARLGDPLDLAREVGQIPAPQAQVQMRLRDRIEAALESLPPGSAEGAADQTWYWAAPFLLDAALGDDQTAFLRAMLGRSDIGDQEAGASAQQDHVRAAAEFDIETLGRRPPDLVQVLALMALAGPGVTALRSLGRIAPSTRLTDVTLRSHAADISWSIRSLFNQPHITDIIRFGMKKDESYWRAVLNHCVAGCLQAVLDEFAHILVASVGKQSSSDLDRTRAVAGEVEAAMSLRTTRNDLDEIEVVDDRIQTTTRRLGVHFAVRFGRDNSDAGKALDREKAVRTAFNSPFWPFVLASTSVGQEGLDFHQYCHAVVHWNLPGNPVDLEQREGRVHRYKNHAVRKNVAATYAKAALASDVHDPWAAVFDAAVADRPADASDLIPFWIFARPNGAVIERYVPALPLSQEAARYRRLQRTVGAYRMVLGQARQEDLLHYAAETAEDLSWLSIDLAPRSTG